MCITHFRASEERETQHLRYAKGCSAGRDGKAAYEAAAQDDLVLLGSSNPMVLQFTGDLGQTQLVTDYEAWELHLLLADYTEFVSCKLVTLLESHCFPICLCF